MYNIVSEKSIIQKSRIDWLDFAKGIGILCVVFGHTQIPYISEYLIRPFHVPLFFFLSGFCFSVKKYNIKEFLSKKIKSLLMPYIFFSLIWIVYETINETIVNGFSFKFLLNEFKLYILQNHLHAIWFITCIFLLQMLAYILVSVCKDKDCLLFALSLVFIVLSFLYKIYVDVKLIWNAEIVIPAMPYFLVGYIIKKNNHVFEKITVFKFIPLWFVSYVLLGYLNIKVSGRTVDMYSNCYGNIAIFYFAAFSGILFVVSLSKIIKRIGFVNYIGRNSLIIFSLHQIFIEIYRKIISHFELRSIEFVLGEFFIFVLSILLAITFNEIIKKTPFVWFINGCNKHQKSIK